MRRGALVLATMLAMSSTAVTATAVEPEQVPEDAATVEQFAGTTRFHTAAELALSAHPDGTTTVLLATGFDFPDALAASYLAGIEDAPILLTNVETIPTVTLDTLTALGAENVILLGGTAAISAEIEETLEESYEVDRLGGAERRETAVQIAVAGGGEVGTIRDLSRVTADPMRTAIVARADDFADALAAGPLAAAGNHPILLSNTSQLPEITRLALEDATLQIEQVIVAGGTSAISDEVMGEIAALDNMQNVHRVEGIDRTMTATAMGTLTRNVLEWDGTQVSLARGDEPADALTLAPAAARSDASLFLARSTEALRGATFGGLQELCGITETMLVAGGDAALLPEVVADARIATVCATHRFVLDGEQEVPGPGDPDGLGFGYLFLDGDTICTFLDVIEIEEATAAHIHEAPAGEDGDIVIPVGTPDPLGWGTDCTDNTELAAALAMDPSEFYVNVHNEDFPAGAIRGQIAEEPVIEEIALALSSDNEVGPGTPPEGSGITGVAVVELIDDGPEICVQDLEVNGLDEDDELTAMHIHVGVEGEAGGIVVPFDGVTTSECVDVDQEVYDAIKADLAGHYLNVHSMTYPGGVVRDQLG